MADLHLEPIASTIMAHGDSAISALVDLITDAVRASRDDHVTVLDRILQDIERMTDAVRRV